MELPRRTAPLSELQAGDESTLYKLHRLLGFTLEQAIGRDAGAPLERCISEHGPELLADVDITVGELLDTISAHDRLKQEAGDEPTDEQIAYCSDVYRRAVRGLAEEHLGRRARHLILGGEAAAGQQEESRPSASPHATDPQGVDELQEDEQDDETVVPRKSQHKRRRLRAPRVRWAELGAAFSGMLLLVAVCGSLALTTQMVSHTVFELVRPGRFSSMGHIYRAQLALALVAVVSVYAMNRFRRFVPSQL